MLFFRELNMISSFWTSIFLFAYLPKFVMGYRSTFNSLRNSKSYCIKDVGAQNST